MAWEQVLGMCLVAIAVAIKMGMMLYEQLR